MKTKQELLLQNPLALAFVGDAVHGLFVRERLVAASIEKAHALHLKSSKMLSAVSQSKAFDKLVLTDEEKEVAMRARNTQYNNKAKHASMEEYQKATMLESVIGWNHLLGNTARVEEICALSFEK